MNKEEIKENSLEYWKQNAEEDYSFVPISVLKYITLLEKLTQENKDTEWRPNEKGEVLTLDKDVEMYRLKEQYDKDLTQIFNSLRESVLDNPKFNTYNIDISFNGKEIIIKK